MSTPKPEKKPYVRIQRTKKERRERRLAGIAERKAARLAARGQRIVILGEAR